MFVNFLVCFVYVEVCDILEDEVEERVEEVREDGEDYRRVLVCDFVKS